jgi:hypothetical protein
MQNNDSQLMGLFLALCVIGAMWGIITLIGMLLDL